MKPKPIKFVAFGDNHGDLADPEACDALEAFVKDYKPDERIHLGDCFDFRSLRQGVGAHDAESTESHKADLDAGLDFIRRFRPTVYLMGNHEARLHRLITQSSSAMIRDYCTDIQDAIHREARKVGVRKIYQYHAEKGVHRLGPVAFIHGYAVGKNATELQGLHYATQGGGLIHGHTHNLSSVALTRHGSGNAFSAGCLCQKQAMDYAAHRLATSRWGSGFVAGWIHGDEWKAWLVHKVGDRWVWTSRLTFWEPK